MISLRISFALLLALLALFIRYQPFGGLKSFTNGAGQDYTRNHDLDGRVSAYSLAGQSWNVAYDAASRILSQADAANPANAANYSYDGLDRLQAASWPGGSLTATYDLNGNRTGQTGTGAGASRNYQVSGTSNHLLNATNPIRNYQYDANGSLINDGSTSI